MYGFGLIGVWRILHLEFSKCDEEVYLDLIQETKICQPETHGYYLCELLEGTYIYDLDMRCYGNDIRD